MNEVENICKKYNKKIIFDRRPKYLSNDKSPTSDVLDLYKKR